MLITTNVFSYRFLIVQSSTEIVMKEHDNNHKKFIFNFRKVTIYRNKLLYKHPTHIYMHIKIRKNKEDFSWLILCSFVTILVTDCTIKNR